METLQQQIEKLTAEHNIKQDTAEKLQGIKHIAFINSGKPRICVDVTTIEEFKKVLSLYPATNTNTVIGTATDKYYKDLNTPFRVDIENPASPNNYSTFELKISYQSNEASINIDIPLLPLLTDFVTSGERNITDSEHHYFIGVSRQKLYSMKVRSYNFKSEQMGWYGGNKTLLSESAINEIIKHLSN